MGAQSTEKTAENAVKAIQKIYDHWKKAKSDKDKLKKATKVLKEAKQARDLMKRADNRRQILQAAKVLEASLDLASDLVPDSVPGLGKMLGVYAKAVGSIKTVKWDIAERYLHKMMVELWRAKKPSHIVVVVKEMRDRFRWTERYTMARVAAFNDALAKKEHAALLEKSK